VRRYLLGIVVLLAALAVAVPFAVRGGVAAFVEGVQRLFGPGRTRNGGVCFTSPGSSPSSFDLEIRSTPGSWWTRGESLACTLTIDADKYLEALMLYSAQDLDENGVIDPSEWTLLCTGSIEESPGRTVATLRETHVDRHAVAWRVVTHDVRYGPWCHQWGQSDLTYLDP
jgi:hypothetical protein